jgi:hypothetical protein
MGGMTASKITTAALVVCLPLTLSACDSGSESKARAAPSSSSSTPTASPTPTFPIATYYRVTAKPGVSDDDLKDAVKDVGKLPGVTAASFNPKTHQLEVEVSAINITKNAPRVYEELAKLGTVSIE